jgi:Tfp pilus assembly protein PilV
MTKNVDNKFIHLSGLTLLEILISTIIFALVVSGLINLFVASKRLISHTRSRMQAVELGKLFVDPLQLEIRQGEVGSNGWDQANNALRITGAGAFRYCDSVASHTQQPDGFCLAQAERTLNNIEFSARYEITNPFAAAPNIRRVVANLTWNEPNP